MEHNITYGVNCYFFFLGGGEVNSETGNSIEQQNQCRILPLTKNVTLQSCILRFVVVSH